MKKVLFVLLCCFGISLLHAQSPEKGFKALQANDYAQARSIFEATLETDPDNVAAHYGMSRIHGIAAAGDKDKEKALDHLIQAEWNYPKGDEKARAKLDKMGVTRANLTERRNRIEKSFLKEATEANTVAAYNAFMERFPESKSVQAALNHRNKVAYDNAQATGTVAALDEFIATYPKSYEAGKAIPVRDQMAADAALKANTESAFRDFIDHYPEAKQAPMIEQRLFATAFENAKAAGTSAALETYIRDYPDSIFIEQAKEKRDWLHGQGK